MERVFDDDESHLNEHEKLCEEKEHLLLPLSLKESPLELRKNMLRLSQRVEAHCGAKARSKDTSKSKEAGLGVSQPGIGVGKLAIRETSVLPEYANRFLL